MCNLLPAVVCPTLPPLTNGMISYSDLTLDVGSVATYSCDPGFVLNGGNLPMRSCLAKGKWFGSAPTCEGKTAVLIVPYILKYSWQFRFMTNSNLVLYFVVKLTLTISI